MKKILLFFSLLFILTFSTVDVSAQCAMCTKTASQLGEKPALGLNKGILYLMLTPFLVIGVIAYKWWKNENKTDPPA